VTQGYLAFVLHAHLPFVRHPEHAAFLEERWYFEALTECYIPLLRALERHVSEGIPVKLSLSLSPTLLAMLEDPLLAERYDRHLDGLIRLSEAEIERNKAEPRVQRLGVMYRALFTEAREYFANYDGRLATAFAQLHDARVVELMTTTATHGILPVLAAVPRSAEAQIEVGLEYFEHVFGFRPQSYWLPECAYVPALERLLTRAGIRAFCLEAHALERANNSPVHGVYAPVYTASGVAAFARDRNSTKEVWSAREGFPGHPEYREFYRDIGHELDEGYIASFTGLGGGVRADTGIKYHRITGRADKEIYDPELARARAEEHARAFLERRRSDLDLIGPATDQRAVVLAPFDAELFGHWWFEGPHWLDTVVREAAARPGAVELTTLSGYLDRHPVHQVASPATSSWGDGGYFETWVNPKTDWIYPQLSDGAVRLSRLAAQHRNPRASAIRRALTQAGRELLLAQGSDWSFLITHGTAEAYATRRVKDHLARLGWLLNAVEKNEVDEDRLAAIEYADNLFPDLDYRVFTESRDPYP
jgi:1,4-alpha-glucan branching enzyme